MRYTDDMVEWIYNARSTDQLLWV